MNANLRRKHLLKTHGRLYKRLHNINGGVCIYCGEPRGCMDHVPPLALVDSMDVGEYVKEGGKFIIYPACTDCNKILNACRYPDLHDRMDYIIGKLDAKLSKIEQWSPEELEEMSHKMQAYIRAHQFKIASLNDKIQRIDERKLKFDNNGQAIIDIDLDD